MKYGRYEVVSEIGRGSMGVVYKAHDPKIDRLVALKVLRQDRVSSEDYVNRFLKEATAVGRLSHRSIVTVFDVGQDHGTIYIAMELLEGIPLDELTKQQTIGFKQIVKIGKEVALALHYAHQKGIVHRDIKPANIICAQNGEVKVTDFGIAHIDDPEGQQMTQAGEILGTPVYMSPEQVLGQPVDGRSDIYSLGVILYELTTGQRPFKAGNLAALFKAITSDDVDEPVKISPQVPESFSTTIMTAMAREPANRFSSGEQLAHQLITVTNKSEPSQVQTRGGTSKLWMAALIFVFLTVGCGVLYYTGYLPSFFDREKERQIQVDTQVEEKPEETTGPPPIPDEDQPDTKDYISKTKEKKIIQRNLEEVNTTDSGVVIDSATASLPTFSTSEQVEDIEEDPIFNQPTNSADEVVTETSPLPPIVDPETKESSYDKSNELTTMGSDKKTTGTKNDPKRLEHDKRTDVKQVKKEIPEDQPKLSEKIVIASLPPVEEKLQKLTRLKMKSRPLGASIYIDGEFIGKTPYEFEVSAVRHEIMLQLEGHGDWKAQLDLSKGGEMPLSIRLLPN